MSVTHFVCRLRRSSKICELLERGFVLKSLPSKSTTVVEFIDA